MNVETKVRCPTYLMNSILKARVLIVGGVFAAFCSSSVFASGVVDLFTEPDLETIVVTDVTRAGAAAGRPSREYPLYYAAVSSGYHDFGGLIAGEKPIARDVMNKTVMKVLAQQGYLPVEPNGRPDIVVIWTWGTLNTYTVETSIGGMNGTIKTQVNEDQMRWILGGSKLGVVYRNDDAVRYTARRRLETSSWVNGAFPEYDVPEGLRIYSGPAQRLIETAKQNLYVAIVSAYKAELNRNGHGEMLWSTRISAPARGFWMPEALPPMLAIAAPYFGRETAQPQWIKASEHFKPEVRLGNPRLVEYIEESASRVKNEGTLR